MSGESDVSKRRLMGGIQYHIINTIASVMNFTYKVMDCNNVWDFRPKVDNYSCDGVVSELYHRVRRSIYCYFFICKNKIIYIYE